MIANKRLLIWPFLLLVLALLGVCRKETRSDFRLYRFIDELRSENIVKSPFLEGARSGREAPASPPKSLPLLDLGSGENPFDLKKKLRLEWIEINILFAPAASVYQYKPDFGTAGTIEFGVGIAPDADRQSQAAQDALTQKGVNFRIRLEKKDRPEVLFQKVMFPPQANEDAFSWHSIEVPPLEKGSHLIFETEGEQDLSAFWFNPILYTRARRTRPVVLLSVDTLRADHLGCYGYGRETSPAADALAMDSALFLNTYASSPWTLPSHVSILTSLNGVHHQVYHEDEKMASDLITLADMMRSAGFMTSAFTDGGFVSRVYGFGRGFDSYQERTDAILIRKSAELVWREASEWLEANWEKDFFLFLHTYQPHNPYVCPHPYGTMFLDEKAGAQSIDVMGHLGGYPGIFRELPEEERRNIIGLYDGEIRYTDEALVKPLVAKLKELGLYDEALIILTSDHGEEFFDHQSWTHGHQLYDEALKVPLIIKFPEAKFKGQKCESIVRLIDIMPTMMEEFGISQAKLKPDGESLFPVLRGKERGDRTFLADIGDNILDSHVGRKIAINDGEYKMILNRAFSQEEMRFFTSPPRLVPPVELFDLAKDPLEKKNVADENPLLARELNARVLEIYRQAGQRKATKAQVDERVKEQLRALGYIR